jgi:hypothetical protein
MVNYRAIPLTSSTFFLAAAVLLGASTALAQAPGQPEIPEGFEIERVDRYVDIPDVTRIVVVNNFGNLHLRKATAAPKMRVYATVQHFADEGPRLEVETELSKGLLSVRIGWRGNPGEALSLERDPEQLKRADVVVFVPFGMQVEAVLEDGTLDAKGLRSDVTTRSTSGDLILSLVEGALDATTDSGRIIAVLKRAATKESQFLRTGSGEVQLHIPEDADLALSVATEGTITSDLALDVGMVKGTRLGTIGQGSHPLTVESATGDVEIVLRLGDAKPRRSRPIDAGQ